MGRGRRKNVLSELAPHPDKEMVAVNFRVRKKLKEEFIDALNGASFSTSLRILMQQIVDEKKTETV